MLVRRIPSICDGGGGRPSGFDSDGSDGDVCPCQYHPALIEQLQDHRYNCHAWMLPPRTAPGRGDVAPLCGVCWRSSCVCGFVFESVDDAFDVWPQDGRLRCAPCALY